MTFIGSHQLIGCLPSLQHLNLDDELQQVKDSELIERDSHSQSKYQVCDESIDPMLWANVGLFALALLLMLFSLAS